MFVDIWQLLFLAQCFLVEGKKVRCDDWKSESMKLIEQQLTHSGANVINNRVPSFHLTMVECPALVVAQWLQCWPTHKEVVGLIPARCKAFWFFYPPLNLL